MIRISDAIALSLVGAPVSSNGTSLELGAEHEIVGSVSIFGYDFSADGQRFLLCLRTSQLARTPLTVVQNWLGILDKKTAR